MRWTIPNYLTILRFLLVPIFLVFILKDTFFAKLISLAIFMIATLTDYLDGQIARRYNQKSEFGKFADPLADKFLVAAAFIAFIKIPQLLIPFWLVLLILSREFIITGLRIAALSQDKSINTSSLGKAKTTAQMLTIMVVLVMLVLNARIRLDGIALNPAEPVLFWAAWSGSTFWGKVIAYTPISLMGITALLTLVSGIRYLIKNKDVIFNDK